MGHTSVLETWKEIPDHPGYEVSDHGQVRSYWRGGRAGRQQVPVPRLLKPVVNSHGRTKVHLGSQAQNKDVHVLVLLAFIGPPGPGQECRHLDGNKTNNRLSNLVWGTRKENAQDGVQHGTWAGQNNGRATITEDTVRRIRAMSSSGMSHRAIGRELNLPDLLVGRIVRRVSWRHIA
jgi:hypothetical protein